MIAAPHGIPTAAQELLLKAALLDGPAAVSAWRQWQQLDSPTQTDQDSGRLLPLVCRKLLALGVEEPELWVLKNSYRHQWLANQHRLAACGAALRVLEAAGLATMVLKGAAIAQRHYGDVGVRPMYDVDVLVRPERARDAVQALVAAGWTAAVPVDLDTVLTAAHGTLYRDLQGSSLDLHWYAMWSSADDEDLWAAAEPARVGGARTLAPCPADQLLMACVHGIWSDGCFTRWVADAVTIVGSTPEIDWSRVVVRARARRVTLPVHKALAYVRDAFAVGVPDAVLSALAGTRRGVLERAAHRAWHAPPSRPRMILLALERYRRQRAFSAACTHSIRLGPYLRSYMRFVLELRRDARLTPALVRTLRSSHRRRVG